MAFGARAKMPVGGLGVSVAAEGEGTVVCLRRDADICTLPAIVRVLAEVTANRTGNVVVDLSETEFIDTAALRSVLRARATLASEGRDLQLRAPSRTTRRALALFGLSGIVSLDPDVLGVAAS